LEDPAGEESKLHSEPLNINIVKKDTAYNKENQPSARAKPRPPPAVGGGAAE
jgi:hypothetical protein